MTTELCRLGLLYGTDKYPYYTPLYDHLLRYRRASVTKVLEIGIGTVEAMKHVPDYQPGASLRMWRDYFPAAQIFGIDIDPSVAFIEEDRITAFVADQRSLNNLVPFIRPIDLIVDDGSHDPHDQLTTFKALYPALAPDGLYIIEDVNPSSFEYLTTHLPTHYYVGAASVSNADAQARCILIYSCSQIQT